MRARYIIVANMTLIGKGAKDADEINTENTSTLKFSTDKVKARVISCEIRGDIDRSWRQGPKMNLQVT